MTLENDLNSPVSWARTVQNENGIPAARKKTDRMALCSGPDEVSKKKTKKKHRL